MRQRLLIFDLDGTLVDSVHLLAQIVNEHLWHAGTTFTVEQYRHWIGHGLRNLVQQAHEAAGGAAVVGREFEQWYRLVETEYGRRAAAETDAYAGVHNMVRSCGQGAVLAVLTNKIESITRDIVATLFPHAFASVCGLTDRYPAKPDPARAHWLMRTHNVTSDACLLIGDSSVDQQTAVRAGIRFCGVAWGYGGGGGDEETIAASPSILPTVIDNIMTHGA